jgi:6-phospho-beta-glucosidase
MEMPDLRVVGSVPAGRLTSGGVDRECTGGNNGTDQAGICWRWEHTSAGHYGIVIIFPRAIARWANLDPERVDVSMIGLNHGCWSVRHLYDGRDMIEVLRAGYEALAGNPGADPIETKMIGLAITMNSLPAEYFKYYYFRDEVFDALRGKPTTRAQDIMNAVPDYWRHYEAQAERNTPELDPESSRGGIHELELAIDAMDAIFNDRQEVLPVNVPNRGAIADFPDDLVVEVPAYLDRNGVHPLTQGHMPRHLVGLLKSLGEYQMLAAEAAWSGNRTDAVRSLAANPLVLSMSKAESIYDEMAHALRDYLPERLLASSGSVGATA